MQRHEVTSRFFQAAAELNRGLFEWPHDTADVFSGSQQLWFRVVALPGIGLSLPMLQALAADPSLCADDNTTTAEFSERLELQTVGRGCSYAELLLSADSGRGARDPTGAPAVGKATHFISHAWRYKFRDTVAAVAAAITQEGLGGGGTAAFLWVDCVSVNQHASQTFPSTWWSGIFRKMIGAFDKFVLVLMPWKSPIPLSRAWCLWEIYSAYTEHKPITVAFGPGQAEQFFATLAADPGTVLSAFQNIDAESARCWGDDDPTSSGYAAKNAIFGESPATLSCGRSSARILLM